MQEIVVFTAAELAAELQDAWECELLRANQLLRIEKPDRQGTYVNTLKCADTRVQEEEGPPSCSYTSSARPPN